MIKIGDKLKIITDATDFELGQEVTANGIHHCGYFVSDGRVGKLVGFDDVGQM